jgi:hypothetical protein
MRLSRDALRRRHSLLGPLLVGTLVVVLTAGPAGAARTPKPAVLTVDQIQAALLTLSDLPTNAGFVEPPPDNTYLLTPHATGGVCNGPDAVALAEKSGNVARSGVVFLNNNTDGPFVFERVYWFPSNDGAKRFLKLSSDSVAACSSGWQDSFEVSSTISPLRFPKLGDQVFASETLGKPSDGLPRTANVVMVRVGNHVIETGRYGLTKTLGPGTAQLLSDTQKALARVTDAVRTTKSGAGPTSTT